MVSRIVKEFKKSYFFAYKFNKGRNIKDHLHLISIYEKIKTFIEVKLKIFS